MNDNSSNRTRISARSHSAIQDANLADYFVHIDALPRGSRVVLWSRVTTWAQDEHVPHQSAILRREAVQRHLDVVGSFERVIQGFNKPTRTTRNKGTPLETAARFAYRNNAALLAESTCRYVRNSSYHPMTNPDVRLTISDLEDLQTRLVVPVTLATLLPPTASPSDIRSFQSKRGQSASGNRGGRPLKHAKLLSADRESLTRKRRLKIAWAKFKSIPPQQR